MPSGRAVLSINGADLGRIYSFQGGDLVGDVVVEASIGGAAPQKHLGGKHYTPLVIEVNIPPGAALADWISDLCAGRDSPKTVVLIENDFDAHPIAASQFNNAILSEVSFPELDASGRGNARLTVTIAVSDRQVLAVGSVSVPPSVSTSTADYAQTNAFQLQLGTLPPYAYKIAAFTLKRGAGGGVTTSSIPTFSNLVLSFNLARVTEWKTWATDFLVNGNSGASAEKSGSLVFQAADQHTVFTLSLGHVGIVRATPSKSADTGTEAVPTVEIELYFETATAGSSPPTTASPSPTTTPRLPTTEESPIKKLVDRKAVTAEAPAATANGNASVSAKDEAGQDPKNFPRAPNMKRKSYLSIGAKEMLQEIASYETKETPEVLDEFYSSHLKATGWTVQTHFASGANKDEQQILTLWKNGERTAMLTMSQSAEGTTVSVSLSTPAAP